MRNSAQWREKGQEYQRLAQNTSDRELGLQFADLAVRFFEMADMAETMRFSPANKK